MVSPAGPSTKASVAPATPGFILLKKMPQKADYILDHLNAGDLVLTLGAGDIWKTGEELLARLQNQAAPRKARRA